MCIYKNNFELSLWRQLRLHRQEVENWNVPILCNPNSVYMYIYLIPYDTILSYMSSCICKNLCGTLKACG